MVTQRLACVGLIAACGVATAMAGPVKEEQVRSQQSVERVPSNLGSPDVMAWMDGFDSYPLGPLVPSGGWEFWGGAAPNATVTDAGSHSAPNSLYYEQFCDVVQRLNYSGGVFLFRAHVFNPSNFFGNDGYIIVLNRYDGTGLPANTSWSLQVRFRNANLSVANDAGGFALAQSLPMVQDQWIEYGAYIDLNNDRLYDWYNGQLLTSEVRTAAGPRPLTWTSNGLNPVVFGDPVFHTIDLYSDGVIGMLVDTLVVTCYADCDQSTGVGVLDIFDFLCFGNYFNAAHPYACDVDITAGFGVCDIFDFLTWGNLFAAGCP